MEHSVNEISCKKAFRKLNRRIGPYEYDMNIYRGCAHHCAYCYAQYSQRYLNQSDFYHDIYVKTNIAERLDQQLSAVRWHHQLINIGSVCDSYQPAEAQYAMMRQILPVMIHHRNPCVISTKSDLILRDLDLIGELASLTYVNIAVTITTPDEKLAAIVEPNAVSPQRRKEVASLVKKHTKATVGIHVLPMMPLINDDEASLRTLMEWIHDTHSDYGTFGSLHLHGVTKHTYFQMLQKHFPRLVTPYQHLYCDGHLDRAYAQTIYQRVGELAQEYGIETDYMKFANEFFSKKRNEQLSLLL